MVIGEALAEDPAQVLLIEQDGVIQALSTNGTDNAVLRMDFAKAAEAYNRSEYGAKDPIDYEQLLEEIAAAGVAGLRNGLTEEENERLFETPSVQEVVGLVRKGLVAVAGDAGG